MSNVDLDTLLIIIQDNFWPVNFFAFFSLFFRFFFVVNARYTPRRHLNNLEFRIKN